MRRNAFLSGALAALPVAALGDPVMRRLAAIEARTGGRLGVAVLDTATPALRAYRGDERFPMCSTFKFLAVAAVLARVDRGADRLERRVRFGSADLLAYAPVTRQHVRAGSMSLGALCAAAIERSDNTAANLLLRTLGGPPGVTAFARAIGDPRTRLDRTEPELNTAIPGDARDTTTPAAMARDVRTLLLGEALSPESRRALGAWMDASVTGTTLLRAGVPAGWRVGDKSGTGGPPNRHGDSGTRNDVALLRPPHGAPIVVTAYLTAATVSAADRDAALASVARAFTAAG